MNYICSFLWRELVNKKSIEEVIINYQQEFSIPLDLVEDKVHSFLQMCVNKGLILPGFRTHYCKKMNIHELNLLK